MVTSNDVQGVNRQPDSTTVSDYNNTQLSSYILFNCYTMGTIGLPDIYT